MSNFIMSNFPLAIHYVLNNEKGLVENEKDPAGITNFGISLRFLKSLSADKLKTYGIFDDVSDYTIRNLTKDQVYNIYEGEFWNSASFWMIKDQDVCNFVFNMAVNMGISPAIKCVQRAIWASYGLIDSFVEDGILGEKTLNYLNEDECILSVIRSELAVNYRVIFAKNPDMEEFEKGWMNRSYHFNTEKNNG